MQTFKDTNNEVWQFEDDVVVTLINGVYTFKDSRGNIIKTSTDLVPHEIVPAPVIQINPLINQAQSALYTLDNGVVIRCFKAGVKFPTAWRDYSNALRNIVNGTDTTSTTLPSPPLKADGSVDYPSGT